MLQGSAFGFFQAAQSLPCRTAAAAFLQPARVGIQPPPGHVPRGARQRGAEKQQQDKRQAGGRPRCLPRQERRPAGGVQEQLRDGPHRFHHGSGLNFEGDRVRVLDLERLIGGPDGRVVEDERHAGDFGHIGTARLQPVGEFPAARLGRRSFFALGAIDIKPLVEVGDLAQVDPLRRVVYGAVGFHDDG